MPDGKSPHARQHLDNRPAVHSPDTLWRPPMPLPGVTPRRWVSLAGDALGLPLAALCALVLVAWLVVILP